MNGYESYLLKGLDVTEEVNEFLNRLVVEELEAADQRRKAHFAAKELLREKFYGVGGKAGISEGSTSEKGHKNRVSVLGDSLNEGDATSDAPSLNSLSLEENKDVHQHAKTGSKYSRLPGTISSVGSQEKLIQQHVEPLIGTRNTVPVLNSKYSLDDERTEQRDGLVQQKLCRVLRPHMTATLEVPMELVKKRVFESLMNRGYHVTSGLKFGGDFLIYPGDPLLFHATHVVVVLDRDAKVTPFDMISYARMGRNAKKKILLCQWNCAENQVQDIVVNWTGWK
ncbi:UNVERIFIED_CONTAM: tRNA-splicing endonuclease subunit Sen34 [Siphonaria sp. JEL0065]|nr:tRNA-splicing endonuclease subunit Sen34 [Siphonaria sp. JEL0065]